MTAGSFSGVLIDDELVVELVVEYGLVDDNLGLWICVWGLLSGQSWFLRWCFSVISLSGVFLAGVVVVVYDEHGLLVYGDLGLQICV